MIIILWSALAAYIVGVFVFPWIYRLPRAKQETANHLGVLVCSLIWPFLFAGFILWFVGEWYIETATGGLNYKK